MDCLTCLGGLKTWGSRCRQRRTDSDGPGVTSYHLLDSGLAYDMMRISYSEHVKQNGMRGLEWSMLYTAFPDSYSCLSQVEMHGGYKRYRYARYTGSEGSGRQLCC